MFGRKLLEGLFGKESYSTISPDFAFALGQRLARRCHYTATTLRVMIWMGERQWGPLRTWLLNDLKNEDPLPPMRSEHGD